MLKRHKQRFLGDLHVDQQKLRAQLEVLRSDVEAFAELGDITQVCRVIQGCEGTEWEERQTAQQAERQTNSKTDKKRLDTQT